MGTLEEFCQSTTRARAEVGLGEITVSYAQMLLLEQRGIVLAADDTLNLDTQKQLMLDIVKAERPLTPQKTWKYRQHVD